MKWDFRKNSAGHRKAFTLIEISVALIILGMIAATVLVVINRAVETVADWQTKMEAFELARENMEKLLALNSVSDMVEYGTSEKNPGINWETTVESFYEPVSNHMWMRAICTAQFVSNSGQEQKIEFTHWLTSLNKKQIEQILEWQQREQQYEESLGKDSQEPNQQPQEQNQQPEQQNQEQQQKDTEGLNSLGAPPAGYKSWEDVPPEKLIEILRGTSKK